MFNPYLLLGGLALGLGLFWLRHQDPRLLRGLTIVLGLLGILFLYDWLRPESVAEQIQRKTEAMASAVAARDLDGIFQHVSDRFSKDGLDKASLRPLAQRVLAHGDLTEVRVWGFDNAQVQDATARIDFQVKVVGSDGEGWFRCTAHFVKDPDGDWRLQAFQLFDAMGRSEVPIRLY